MLNKYDFIIIGGGPNGLTAGAYLAKAKQKVLIVERRGEVGGGLVTEEATITPRFLHNIHAVYMMMVDYAPAYKDFDLENLYNLKHVYPELQIAMPFKDGRALCLYRDLEKSCESISKFSKKDAQTYRDIYLKFKELVDEFIAPATYAPPVPALEQIPKLEKSPIGKEIMEYSEKSPKTIVYDLFENEYVKALMLYISCMWGLDPEQEGVGYLVPLYINRATNYRLCVNGSHSLSQAINKVFLENGGHITSPRRIVKILIKDNRASGIELEDGTVVEAKKGIISTIDLHQTFLELVGKEYLDKEFVESVKLWKWEHWSLLGIHLALDEAPKFKNPEIDRALVYILGYETADDFIEHYRAIGNGKIIGGFYCSFPSIHDPTQAPPGRHTGIISQMVPYSIDGDKNKWYPFKFREEQAERCLNILREYAPNITADKIRNIYVSTPVDIENKFLDMVNGSIKQGAYHPLQMGYLRPNEYCSTHRSPINGLYMGGSCTYPGGTVILGPGYLVANAVSEDFGIKRWWKEPGFVKKAKEKGLL
jgi:phytoene dehydrogenase-like protein